MEKQQLNWHDMDEYIQIPGSSSTSRYLKRRPSTSIHY